jgi:hypothetical protein
VVESISPECGTIKGVQSTTTNQGRNMDEIIRTRSGRGYLARDGRIVTGPDAMRLTPDEVAWVYGTAERPVRKPKPKPKVLLATPRIRVVSGGGFETNRRRH